MKKLYYNGDILSMKNREDAPVFLYSLINGFLKGYSKIS